MKNYKLFGFLSCVILAISCFLPWAYYPDLQKSFTGFFTQHNIYGRPGKVFVFFSVVCVILVFINKIWAKRTLIFLAALNLGYLLKTYVIFTSCYNAYCPQKEYGLYLLIISSLGLMLISLFPDLKVEDKPDEEDLPLQKDNKI